eukprot:2855528-Pyramimonas_sp.AAC.1
MEAQDKDLGTRQFYQARDHKCAYLETSLHCIRITDARVHDELLPIELLAEQLLVALPEIPWQLDPLQKVAKDDGRARGDEHAESAPARSELAEFRSNVFVHLVLLRVEVG